MCIPIEPVYVLVSIGVAILNTALIMYFLYQSDFNVQSACQ